MNVSHATTGDAQDILALQHLAYQTEAARYDDDTLPPLLEHLADLLARFGDRRFLKAVEADQIIGSVRGYQEGDTCFVERLIVHPDCRRQGIGTTLLTEIESLFPTARRFELFTGTKSESNIRLYERLGYRAFRHEPVNEMVTLVFMEKVVPRLTIRLNRLELIAATKELLEAEEDLERLGEYLRADVPANWPTPLYDNDARQHFLRVVSENPDAVGWTAWYILLLDDTEKRTLVGAVGACGLPDGDGKIVIGYSLLDQFHGQGYATEALRGFLNWAKREPLLRKVVADTFPHLTPSIRVLEKNGFIRSGVGTEEGSIQFHLWVR
jgi:RimJ/RimL family protein N-acetyltransferase